MNTKKKETRWLIFLLCMIGVLGTALLFACRISPEESSAPADSQIEESQPEESQPEESRPEESRPEESRPEESQIEESDREESKIEESKSGTEESRTAQPAVDESWNRILVNRKHPLPEGFTVETKAINDSHCVDARIYDALVAMLDAARAEGLSPVICSSFRTMDGQTRLFNREFNDWLSQGYSEADAYQLTAQSTAVPGTSEHQAGLAVDIVSNSNWNLDESQEKTAEQQWLMAHCAEYGFILRYPTNKKEYTGIMYEPWHYRYVGVELARYLTDNGLCLEEYLDPGVTIDPYTGE